MGERLTSVTLRPLALIAALTAMYSSRKVLRALPIAVGKEMQYLSSTPLHGSVAYGKH